ncbi:MAG: diaminopimelate epimerase [Acidobacteria bacterium RIFCSPLOWO2_12_FULL_65_11]|nr:MAG: diaminopimelate epimerase [Acidobacteria bacterium RIFCSPLOWO2_02_FULL_64_15]OFW33791.1 MAG: diaminopimelate epimerase [Acidobacteria bacterium RIFCSPLOWO2_12_FULL_65_11]
MRFLKAHAYGNDFLYVKKDAVQGVTPEPLARQLCDRHRGIGADGLILYEPTPDGASMQLFNADGGRAEVSGNGVRALGALLLRDDNRVQISLTIHTEAGPKRLERLSREGARQTFRAAMGLPRDLRQVPAVVANESLQLVLMDFGNPHCVVLGSLPGRNRFERLGRSLAHHQMFPGGTNVEFADVELPGSVRIFIWERGVGPTASSGTGSCAALVAAAAFGGARREADVIAPGGTQRVEWRDESVYLTGWAEVLAEGNWLPER